MTPEQIKDAILNLNVRELVHLYQLLRDEGIEPPDIGVREPRRPRGPFSSTSGEVSLLPREMD